MAGKLSIVIVLSEQAQTVIPDVCRYMDMPSDQITPNNMSDLFETLLMEKALDSASDTKAGRKVVDTAAAVSEILDPNVSLGVETSFNDSERPVEVSPLEIWDALYENVMVDPWITDIKALQKDQDIWKTALVEVYRRVQGADRKSWQTWILIERTYRSLKKLGVDMASNVGQNMGIPSGDGPSNENH